MSEVVTNRSREERVDLLKGVPLRLDTRSCSNARIAKQMCVRATILSRGSLLIFWGFLRGLYLLMYKSAVSTHPKQGNPSKIRAQRVATWLAEPLPFGTFEPPKSKGGRVKQGALASSRHWLGERNGPEQHRAASAVPKARHSPQRHP